jgi:hypothetical protein
MVAVIHSGKNLKAVLNYNEQKVQEQVATCIDALNYPLEPCDLSYNQKLMRLQKLADLNLRSKEKAVHISLNFHPSEKLSDDLLREITTEYMRKIGFEGQPYLLYQHFDSGHPHVHLVTTNIRPDGKRISLHNLGKIQSEQARKEIELRYGLVQAEQQQNELFKIKKIDSARVQYGKNETRRAIYNVLCTVLKPYKYTSLAELNAVLRLYNVAAERGSKDSRVHKNRGLLYRVLDGDGAPVGVPIKASLFPEMFPQKPTLSYIESRYIINETLRQPDKKRVKSAIDFALIHGQRTSIQDMVKELNGKGIATVLRQNEDGLFYGITFIDHQTKAVFNGSDLGKQYSAKGIAERCKGGKESENRNQNTQTQDIDSVITAGLRKQADTVIPAGLTKDTANNTVLDDLLKVEYGADYLPGQWKKKRRRKRRNQSNNL